MSAKGKYGNGTRGRQLSPVTDSEAHSTVMEFIDYTEYLHSDITRSLTLIQKLDKDYISCTSTLDSLAEKYGTLKPPMTKLSESQSRSIEEDKVVKLARSLREGMAKALNGAMKDREETVAEASRLYDNVDRHFNRLTDIINKLQNISVPVRENSLADKGNVTDDAGSSDTHMRITLRLDGGRNSAASSPQVDKHTYSRAKPTNRRKSTTSGLLPSAHTNGRASRSGDLNTTSASTSANISNTNSLHPQSPDSDSDWKDLPDGPAIVSEADRISTLSDYVDEDGTHYPWFELLPAELAILRKRMKKNSTWQPSDAMMLKQLETLGRGIVGFKKWAKRTDQDKAEVARILGGDGGTGAGLLEAALKNGRDNKGMKLNIMKRAKREREKAEAAAAAADAIGSAMAKRNNSISDEPIVVSDGAGRRGEVKFNRKPIIPPVIEAQAAGIKRKKLNSDKTSPMGTVKVGGPCALSLLPPSRDPAKLKNQGAPKVPKPGPMLKLVSRTIRPDTNGGPRTANGDDIAVRAASLEVDDDMPIDPNEPTYCICDKISYGVMVGCDNEECPKEWFHMECVGLKVEPSETTRWFCPLCRESLGVDEAGVSKKDSAVKVGKKRRKVFR